MKFHQEQKSDTSTYYCEPAPRDCRTPNHKHPGVREFSPRVLSGQEVGPGFHENGVVILLICEVKEVESSNRRRQQIPICHLAYRCTNR